MKKVFFLLIFTLIFLSASNSGFAQIEQSMKYTKGQIKLSLPDTWKSSFDNDVLTFTNKDETVAIVFVLLEAANVDAAMSEVDKEMAKMYDSLQISDPTQSKLNGMDYFSSVGTGLLKPENNKMQILLSLLNTPNGKMLFIHGLGDQASVDASEKELDYIFENIKPDTNE